MIELIIKCLLFVILIIVAPLLVRPKEKDKD